MAVVVAGYALSPIDLIPDVIPVLGYLDDLILVPAGLWLVLRLIPAEVLAAHRLAAETALERPVGRVAAAIVVALWMAMAVVAGLAVVRILR